MGGGGGFTLGTGVGGGLEGTDRERRRKEALGLFDLTGLGGDFDSPLIAFIFAEVMSPASGPPKQAHLLTVNSFKWALGTFSKGLE